MSDFILDDTTLNFPKTNVRPVPANTQGVLTADDWGLTCQAAYDIRNAIKRGKYHGWTAQASDPVPAGLDRYIWVRTDDQVLLVSSNGTSLAAVGKVTAKGDLLVFDGTKFRVVPIGTDNQTLIADSAQPAGLRWGAGGGSLSLTPYTCGAGVGVRALVYMTGADAVDKANATANNAAADAIGFVQSKPTGTSCIVQYSGELGGFAGLTPGAEYFMDKTTPGNIVSDISGFGAGNVSKHVGFARNSTTLVIEIDRDATVL